MLVIPSFADGWDGEDHGSRPSWAKKFLRPHFNREKLGVVVCTCHYRDDSKHKKRGLWSRPAWVKSKTLFPNNQSKKGRRLGPSTRVPVLQVQSSEFKPQYCQKEKFKNCKQLDVFPRETKEFNYEHLYNRSPNCDICLRIILLWLEYKSVKLLWKTIGIS
jgi:hypothetical protein